MITIISDADKKYSYATRKNIVNILKRIAQKWEYNSISQSEDTEFVRGLNQGQILAAQDIRNILGMIESDKFDMNKVL